jgi:hypothetical protein
MRRALALLGLLAGTARADETPSDWQAAPRPDQASGIERDDAVPMRQRLLWIPRAILFVPRWVVWGVGQPLRGAAYAYERYDLPGRYTRAFFNDEETFGLYPVAAYDSDYGLSAGVRLMHRNLVGLQMRAEIGEDDRAVVGGHFRTGRLFRHFEGELELEYRSLPNEPFFGIGDGANDDEVTFAEEWKHISPALDFAVADPLTLRLVGIVTVRQLDGMDTSTAGFDTQVIYDSRRPTEAYANPVNDATGWRASIHGGHTVGIREDDSSFRTYGAEVQRFFDLYRGTRILAVRAMLEGVDGDASFLDLPRLGGTEFLRGYTRDRFRDKVSTLFSAEYGWELGNFLGAYTFVDVGRVWPAFSDIAVAKPRVGYGGGLQVTAGALYVGRVQFARSGDGNNSVSLVVGTTFPSRKHLGRP